MDNEETVQESCEHKHVTAIKKGRKTITLQCTNGNCGHVFVVHAPLPNDRFFPASAMKKKIGKHKKPAHKER